MTDEPPPTKEVRDITDYCHSRCNANVHHILWGNTSINPRGESLMEFLVSKVKGKVVPVLNELSITP
jgi:hypothetical protein